MKPKIKMPQRKPHKAMSGEELLNKLSKKYARVKSNEDDFAKSGKN